MSLRNFVYALLYLGATNGTFDPQKKKANLEIHARGIHTMLV